jgi:Helix-turn-helix family
MAELSSRETVQAVSRTIHNVGTTWMLDDEIGRHGKRHGYGEGLQFYFAGRGGVLGDVDASVVAAAMGFWEPGLVRAGWEEGVAVAGPREGARQYAQACADWGETHLAGFDGAERLVELAEQLVAAVDIAGLPLFAGWRSMPRPASGPGRLIHLIHLLRELRGEMHLVAVTAAGLSPLEAMLTSDGEGQARFFGWGEDFPDVSRLIDRRGQAEDTTDRLATAVYERAFSPLERAEFADLVAKLGARVLG